MFIPGQTVTLECTTKSLLSITELKSKVASVHAVGQSMSELPIVLHLIVPSEEPEMRKITKESLRKKSKPRPPSQHGTECTGDRLFQKVSHKGSQGLLEAV